MNNEQRIKPITALLMLPGLAAANAQSTNTPAATGTNTPVQLQKVVVHGQQDSYKPEAVASPKFSEPLRDTPQSVTVISRDLMDDQNNTTLRDALRNVAGVSIAAGEGGSQGDNLTLRGFTARGDIFLDGMRDFGSYYRDSFDLEQVDALKGPESVMFGRGSTGGVINQETKTPSLKPLIEGTFSLGTDLTRRAVFDINEPAPALGKGTAFRLNLMGNDSEVADRDRGENRRFGVAPSLAFGLGTATRVTFSYLHQSEDDVPDYGIPWYLNGPAPVTRNNYYGFKDDYLKTDVDIGTIKLEHDFNDSISIRDQVRYANYVRDFRITEPRVNGTAPLTPATTITRNELGGHSTESYLGNQLDLTAKFDTGPINHTLVTGLDAGRETSDPTRLGFSGVPGTTLFSPNENQNFSGASTNRTKVSTTAITLGVYAVDTLKLGRHWEVSGGFRWDYFDADYREKVANPDAKFHRVDMMPSWRAAIVYKPVENGSIYFDYGTSFNPSAESLSLSAANANLPPEENQTFELGTKWDLFEERLSVRSAIYRTEKLNAREPSVDDPTVNVLAGEQRVDGFEFEVAGRITDTWQVFSGYSYMHSELVSSKAYPNSVGAQLANVPEHTFNLWTTYQLPWNLQVGGGVNYVASRTASSTAPNDPTTGKLKEVPDYYTLNAMVKYQMNDHVAFQVNLNNLTDNYYIDQVHPGHLIPGAGISALFSCTVKF